MNHHEVEEASTNEGIPVSISLGPALKAAEVPVEAANVDARVVFICGLSILLAVAAAYIARALTALINMITGVAFFGHWSVAPASPGKQLLGWMVIFVPVVGGIIVGLMARYGSKAIRGHGIPEAMEQVLLNQSRIPARMTFLKPLSAAVAIGTGGPFGAEGPIIATGGALGSLIGQALHTTAWERKTLLAAGAAAGMAATFGTPVSAVLLAVELLLFEFRARSIVPVALAAVTAAGMRIAFHLEYPVFEMPSLAPPGGLALIAYILIGAIMGLVATVVTRAVYWIEDLFEHVPVHWMWWPAIGGVFVGVIGFFEPRTMGVGYANITRVLSSQPAVGLALLFVGLKFVSWSVALGSGTSGGTLAPLFTLGGGVGAAMGVIAAKAFPAASIDPRIAALVGMAALFAGASRALLASVVFAFETTLQPLGLLPLLGGCSAAYLVSCLTMRNSIMTEKIARRGVRVPSEYLADFLDTVHVHAMASSNVVTLAATATVEATRAWMNSHQPGTTHQGFPIIDSTGLLAGVLTRRDLLAPGLDPQTTLAQLVKRPPSYVYHDCTLRDAADHMVRHDIGRVVVVDRKNPGRVTGILTRSDILRGHRRRIWDDEQRSASLFPPARG